MRYLYYLLLFLLLGFKQEPTPSPFVNLSTGTYKVVFDRVTRVPTMVAYKLYKGGGNCDRNQFNFTVGPGTASSKDYANSGYDQGHLANAEDFAGDCEAMRKTFTYYNCAPQFPNLNRGVWAKYEYDSRVISQHDSVLIVCGTYCGRSTPKMMGRVVVPVAYWKVVQSLSTGKLYYCFIATNEAKPRLLPATLDSIQRMCPIPVPLKKFSR